MQEKAIPSVRKEQLSFFLVAFWSGLMLSRPFKSPDNNKSEIVIAVTISQVRKGLTQQNPFVAPLL